MTMVPALLPGGPENQGRCLECVALRVNTYLKEWPCTRNGEVVLQLPTLRPPMSEKLSYRERH